MHKRIQESVHLYLYNPNPLLIGKVKIYQTLSKNILSIYRGNVSVTPILGILVAIGSGLALVAVAIILVLKFRPSPHSGYGNPGAAGGHRRHKDRTYLAAPHLPLDRQHREMPDECIDLEEKDPDIIPTNKGRATKTGKRVNPENG